VAIKSTDFDSVKLIAFNYNYLEANPSNGNTIHVRFDTLSFKPCYIDSNGAKFSFDRKYKREE
jgi:hypothetical protein